MTPKIAPRTFALALGLAQLAGPSAVAQPAPAPQPSPPRPAAAAPATRPPATSPAAGATTPGTAARPTNTNGLRFNFRGAPLETVLNYMSEAAGFIIVLESPVRGTIDMWSSQPVSREEAVNLLNLALNKNGYTARVQGRNLIVSTKEDAKQRNIPIRTGNDPAEIPETADMVMQIIPLRYIDAMQAATDLATLLPSSATITANQDSNSIVVTDTQMNVRHIVTLVSALDTSIDSVSTMRIFKLQNADPVEMANLLMNIFQAPVTGAAANRAAASAASRSKTGKTRKQGSSSGGVRSTPVIAVADPRTFTIIVTASKDDMPEVSEIVEQLDASSERKQKVFVYTLENADVRQVENVLKNLFQTGSARTPTSNEPDPLLTRARSNAQTSGANTSLGNTRR
jgi:general secretion pathway protein D